MVIAAQSRDWKPSRTASDRAGRGAFWGISGLIFIVSVASTVRCASMPAMGEMRMPGGWTMSMVWMRMPGETWSAAAASFTAMWAVMMIAMMLPSLATTLWRYREAVCEKGETHPGRLTAVVAAGYFFVWTAIGIAIFPAGAALAALEMQRPGIAHAVPVAVGVVVAMAGALQLTGWKAHHLLCCREAPVRGHTLPVAADTAWLYGLRLGIHCSFGCSGLTAILLVMGIMDLRTMGVVTVAITAERLVPGGVRAARVIGAVTVAAGLFLIAQEAMLR